MSKKKEHHIRKKRYNDLKTLCDEINSAKVEKVESFNGWKIVTNKNVYTLYDSIVYKNGEAHGTN